MKKTEVLNAYRQLLKATRKSFAGDTKCFKLLPSKFAINSRKIETFLRNLMFRNSLTKLVKLPILSLPLSFKLSSMIVVAMLIFPFTLTLKV
ncbi:Mitochondrial zinc maintenance protein 1 mitochondrial [Bienertia sinuspersici]